MKESDEKHIVEDSDSPKIISIRFTPENQFESIHPIRLHMAVTQ